jgi:hypothetical protein
MLTVLIVAGAATAGVAAGRWIYSRIRRRQAAVAPPESKPVERGPIALGDVLVLDDGHGRELWAARELSYQEGDAPAFLVLFEADGKADERAILAWEPTDPDHFAVLRPRVWSDAVPARLPSTLEIEGGSNRVSLAARRTGKGIFGKVPDAAGKSDLPYEGAALVGIYRGGGRAYAIAVRDSSEKMKLYVGHTVALSSVSVLSASAP